MTSQTVDEEHRTELALPPADYLSRELTAVQAFQRLVHQHMVEGSDYGVIPGTSKPTLLKPGAEKISKLLGLADHYEIMDKIEDWDRPLFRYLVKCQLRSVRSGVVVAESFGECNSMESKYRWRWLFASALPKGIDKDILITRAINTRNGKATQYRLDSEDIYSQVNTMVKMAQKRALVGAALSAGRLSEIFTQDMEDLPRETPDEEPPPKPRGGIGAGKVSPPEGSPLSELTSQEADLISALEAVTSEAELRPLATAISKLDDGAARARLVTTYTATAARLKKGT